MKVVEAPAKLNLTLLVSPPRADGYHPLQSLVQTVDWFDLLEAERGEGADELESGFDDDLVLRALAVSREFGDVPPLSVRLDKQIPVSSGMGGGSSDAAAALLAASELGDLPGPRLAEAASRVGADVALFLTGGTMMMTGFGSDIEAVDPVAGFATAIVVPEFGISTKDAYDTWDSLEGPESTPIADESLPPSLRGGMPVRNDLLPAALAVEPRLGDFMSDVAAVWGAPLSLTGSGSACFGYFTTVDEAADAVSAVSSLCADGRGVGLRDHGVSIVQPST